MTRTFADVLSQAIADRGLTLERLAGRLKTAGVPVSIATLSYWQSGRSQPERASSLKALPLLEQVLGIPEGILAQHLSPPKPRGRAAATLKTAKRVSRNLPIGEAGAADAGHIGAEIIEKWGIAMPGRLTPVSVHDRLIVTEDGVDGTIVTRQVLRAEVDGVTAFPVFYVQDQVLADDEQPPSDSNYAKSLVVPLSECDVGRVERDDKLNLVVAEMLLSRTLNRGDYIMTEHKVDAAPSDTLTDRIQRAFRQPVREVVTEATFHQNAVPLRAVRFVRATIDGPDIDLGEAPIVNNQVQAVFLDMRGGTCGLRWEWD